MARKAIPQEMRDNSKVRKTKAVLKGEKKVEEDLEKIPATLTCPANVTGIAKREWERIVRLWKSTEFRYLNNLDIASLKCYVDYVERYEIARAKWESLEKQIVAEAVEDKKKTVSNKKTNTKLTDSSKEVQEAVVKNTTNEKWKDKQRMLDRVLKEMTISAEGIALFASKLCLDTVSREKLAIAGGKIAKQKRNPLLDMMND